MGHVIGIWQPPSVEELLRCQSCGATVDWRKARPSPRSAGKLCPECGAIRLRSRNARREMADAVAIRDKGICHRCEEPVDLSLPAGHPLAPECDHHPIPKEAGGPTVPENLKLSHRVCNGGPPGPISYAKCSPEQLVALAAVLASLDAKGYPTAFPE